MEAVFKIFVVLSILALGIGYIETRCAHKKAVETHVDLSNKIEKFVSDKLDHISLPSKHGHK